ncbi:Ig-like domain-containing protein, partial [Sulfitobacter aestuarii]
SLILEGGAPPDTGDDDGNMQLSAPDTTIDADENDAVIITLAGLDADATAVVTLSVNGSTVSQTTASNGNLVFDLSGLPDGQVTSSVTATDGGGNASTVSGPVLTLATAPDTSADVDGNLTVSAPDDYISDTEVSAVTFDVTGIDGDASAVVTVGDGSNSVSSTPLSGDGSVTLDLRSLADGSLTVSIEAQDGSGNMTGGTGTQITLDAGTDTTADLDGNLAVSAPDTQIDVDERSAVTFIASGIDADATAVISVSDGTATVTSAPLAGDGSVILDLSSLADGNLSLSITATDAAANSATAVGPTLILDSAPPPPANALVGTEGRETLEDGGGDGELYGLGDRDKLYGNGGNDTLEGGTGRDFLYGGSGADVFRYRASDLVGDRDNIEDFSIAEGDKVDL